MNEIMCSQTNIFSFKYKKNLDIRMVSECSNLFLTVKFCEKLLKNENDIT